ncbi:MAG: ABC transporter ATP-binding protein [Gaiellales bacterium]
MTDILEVSQLTKRFRDVLAVDAVSFSVRQGETVGVLGPNGAGKSTTIHMILGLITPSSGSVRILGRDPHHDREVLRQVGFAATYISLPQTLTVRENLKVFARLYGVSGAAARIDHVLERLGVAHLRDRPCRHLSSGQSTMATLAKSLINSPRLLLLDEPTASLDPDAADRARRQLQAFAEEEGITVLITSHNMKEITELCDRIVFIRHGSVVAEGSPRELNERYATDDLEDVFIQVARGRAGS